MRTLRLPIVAALFLSFSSCKKEKHIDPIVDPTFPSTLNEGLLLYMPFNGNLADSSGLSNNGTAFGTIAYKHNRYFEDGRSLELNGTNNRIEIPGSKFDMLTNFTIYMEFMPYSEAPMTLLSRALFTPTAPNTRQSFSVMANHEGGTRFKMKKPGNCDNTDNVSSFGASVLGQALPAINAWNYITVTYNGTTINSYLNGVLVASSNQPGANTCSEAPLIIGSWWQGDPYYFNGRIDELRVYNRALSSVEIAQIHQLHK